MRSKSNVETARLRSIIFHSPVIAVDDVMRICQPLRIFQSLGKEDGKFKKPAMRHDKNLSPVLLGLILTPETVRAAAPRSMNGISLQRAAPRDARKVNSLNAGSYFAGIKSNLPDDSS